MVQVTQASPSSQSANLEQQQQGCCGGKQQKSPEQLEQEEIAAIQLYVREMHRDGKYEEALEVCETLIQKCEQVFGVNHPVTASSYNNAAVMHKMLGNYNEARTRYQNALGVYEKVVGQDHSSYASALNNLGNLAKSQVQLDDTLTALERLQLLQSSVDYIQQALNIRILELGEDHPHTVTSRSNLGGALAAQFLHSTATKTRSSSPQITQQQREMAEEHLRTALKLALKNQEKISKPDENDGGLVAIRSLSAAAAAQNLAVFLKVIADQHTTNPSGETNSMDMYLEAKWLYEQALAVRKEKLLGHYHHDTIATMSSLAELRAAIGDEEGASQLRQEILNSLEQVVSSEEKES